MSAEAACRDAKTRISDPGLPPAVAEGIRGAAVNNGKEVIQCLVVVNRVRG